jgi:hypothetical protein
MTATCRRSGGLAGRFAAAAIALADPGPNGETDFSRTGVDPTSPFVEKANELCGKQIGAPAWWINGTGGPGDVSVTNIGRRGPSGGPPPSGGVPVPVTNGGSDSNG